MKKYYFNVKTERGNYTSKIFDEKHHDDVSELIYQAVLNNLNYMEIETDFCVVILSAETLKTAEFCIYEIT